MTVNGVNIEFHADDYGLCPQQSREILACAEQGVLNGVSIMPNSPFLGESMGMIPKGMEMAVTIHLSLYEGKALGGEQVPHLRNSEGNLSCGFGKLLLASCLPGLRKTYYEELKTELRAQIEACMPYVDTENVRLDGHGHYHMVPVVFDALMSVCRELDLKISYIRVPREDLALYRRHKKEIVENGKLNILKAVILNTLSKRNIRKYPDMFRKLTIPYFMGVYLSGHMCIENVAPILQDAINTAEKLGKPMEILFHPGHMTEQQEIEQITSPADREFMTSEWRKREGNALKELRTYLS